MSLSSKKLTENLKIRDIKDDASIKIQNKLEKEAVESYNTCPHI